VLDSVHIAVPKGYIYFAVFFSLVVEIININLRKKQDAVALKRKIKNEVKD